MFDEIFTEYGINFYTLMKQQLHNYHIDWDFMNNSIPFHYLRYHTVGMISTNANVCLDKRQWKMHIPKLYERESLYASPAVWRIKYWVQPEDAPDDAFFHRVADAAGQLTYSAILHMVHLHHGCIPDHVSFFQKVWRWMCRLSLFWQQDLRKVLLNANFDNAPLIDDQWFKAGSIVHGQSNWLKINQFNG